MPPTKGQRTRERIVATAAPLFNQRGYAGASMADVMAATGLQKGGLYRHFESKDDLALAAFDHALALHGERIRSYVQAEETAVARVAAVANGLASIVEDPVLPGGCPILNTAVECDDASGPTYDKLRNRARAGMRQLIRYTRTIIAQGITRGELRRDIDATDEATMLVATMEGALVLSRLFDDARYARRAAARLERHAAAMARSSR